MDPRVSDVVMRAFGSAADLDLDFTSADRPSLVTALLSQCSDPGDSAFWWAQPVSVRTAALFRVLARTEARDHVTLNSRCVDAACRETFEVELPLAPIASVRTATGALTVRLADDRVVAMRLPTGDDLRRWRAAQPHSRAEALRLMLQSLVLDGDAGPEDEAALAGTIAASDPLVDFAVSCQCPACGASARVTVDLEALVLTRLYRRQRALLHEVHQFALRYGWTESEVLAVPPSRRARYLALIEDAR